METIDPIIRLENEHVCFAGRIFSVVQVEQVLPNGQIAQRDLVRHPGAVVMLPQTSSGRLLLVRQYRAAIDKQLLEFPAGTLEVGEEPLDCAQRELQEEVKFRAQIWQSLGILYPAPGFCDELQHLFYATGLVAASLPCDDDEHISVEEYSVSQVEAAITDGALCDSKSIAIFYRAKLSGVLAEQI